MKRRTFIAITLSLLLLSCSENLEDRAKRESQEYTEKNCPIPLNEIVTLDSMTFSKKSHTFEYYYSLSPKFDVKNMNVEETKQAMLKQLVNMTSLRLYKDAGYAFRYIYYPLQDPSNHVIDIRFTAKDYK